MSNTIMAVEADEAHAVIWTKPDDLEFDPQKPRTRIDGAARPRIQCGLLRRVREIHPGFDRFGDSCKTW